MWRSTWTADQPAHLASARQSNPPMLAATEKARLPMVDSLQVERICNKMADWSTRRPDTPASAGLRSRGVAKCNRVLCRLVCGDLVPRLCCTEARPYWFQFPSHGIDHSGGLRGGRAGSAPSPWAKD